MSKQPATLQGILDMLMIAPDATSEYVKECLMQRFAAAHSSGYQKGQEDLEWSDSARVKRSRAWVKTSKMPPRKGIKVLALDRDSRYHLAHLGYTPGNDANLRWYSESAGWLDIKTCPHWQPLPELPK